jgi:hypothetical protein
MLEMDSDNLSHEFSHSRRMGKTFQRWQALPNQDSSLQITSAANLPRLLEDHLVGSEYD